jgi:hypothetical protein
MADPAVTRMGVGVNDGSFVVRYQVDAIGM